MALGNHKWQPGKSGAQAPQVNAGTDPATAGLTGTVTDDDLPNPPGAFTITWSKDSGSGMVTLRP